VHYRLYKTSLIFVNCFYPYFEPWFRLFDCLFLYTQDIVFHFKIKSVFCVKQKNAFTFQKERT